MTYYKKDGYVVDAKVTITYSSPITFFRKTKRKLLLKNTVKTRRPQIHKKNMHKIKKNKTAGHLINKYNK